MVVGIGIDIVDVQEFRRRRSDELIAELFLPAEVDYARTQVRSWENFAARLAAKEAVFKALEAGLAQGLRWHDVEVVRDPDGPPLLVLHGRARELAESRGVAASFLSLSHTRESAIATVIMTGPDA